MMGAAPAVADGGAAQVCATGQDVDFNGDNLADVAVPEPNATVAGQSGAGRVVIYFGGGGSFTLSQETPGVPGVAEAGDHFGAAVAVFDLLGDGCDDLMIGAPDEDVGSRGNAGAVWRVPGSEGGLDTEATVAFSQGEVGYPGVPEAGDRFGAAVAGEQVFGEFRTVIGAPGEDHNAVDAGAVFVDLGARIVSITQDSVGVAGAEEAGDRFGERVAVARRAIVVAAPREDLGGRRDAGIVQVFSPNPDTPGFVRTLSQDATGVSGTPESGDRFGAALVARHYEVPDDDDHIAIVIGVPGESVTSADADHGMVHSLFMNQFVSNPVTDYPVHQNTPGVLGVAEPTDQFGSQVSFGIFGPADAEPRNAVTVVSPNEGTDGSQGAIPAIQTFLPASGFELGDIDRWIKPGNHGIPADADLTTAYAEGRDAGLFLRDADGNHVYGVPWNNVFLGGTEPVVTYQI